MLVAEVVRLAGHPKLQLRVTTPKGSSSAAGHSFGVHCVGGSFIRPESILMWQIDNGSSGSLFLRSLSLHLDEIPSSAEMAFDSQIFPDLCLMQQHTGHASQCMVAGLLSSGTAFTFDPAEASVQGGFLRYCDLSAQLQSHGSPTAISAVAGNLLVGCSDGVVLGLPLSAFARVNGQGSSPAASVFELRAGSWGGINRLIAGVFVRASQPAVAACHALVLPGRPPLALVVYDDCAVRAFGIDRHQEALSDTLLLGGAQAGPQHDARRMVVTSVALCAQPGNTRQQQPECAVLVATLEATDSSSKLIVALTLAPTAAGGRVAVQARRELSGSGRGGTVISACLEGDETIWVLLRSAQGSTSLAGFSRASGAHCKAGVLIEQQSALAFANVAQGNAVMAQLWDDVLSAFASEGFTAEGQAEAHMLAPARLCRASLRHSLACHGVQLTPSEAESAPMHQLRAYVRGAVQTLQRRSPGLSSSRAWAGFLGTYRETWASRHGPLGLFALEGGSGTAVCVVRAGGLVASLRTCTAVEEVWASQALQPLRLSALAADGELAAVHECAAAASGLLGPQCMDAFVGLVAAGEMRSSVCCSSPWRSCSSAALI